MLAILAGIFNKKRRITKRLLGLKNPHLILLQKILLPDKGNNQIRGIDQFHREIFPDDSTVFYYPSIFHPGRFSLIIAKAQKNIYGSSSNCPG